MTATLFRYRDNLARTVDAVSAEDNWQDIIDNWLLDDIITLPLGTYIIAQDNGIGTFELDEDENGGRYLELTSFLSLDKTERVMKWR